MGGFLEWQAVVGRVGKKGRNRSGDKGGVDNTTHNFFFTSPEIQ